MTEQPRSQSLYDREDDVPVAPPQEPVSRWEDFIDIFYAPSAVFRRRQGTSAFIPILVVTVLLGAIVFAGAGVLQPIFEAEAGRQVAAMLKKQPQTPAAALEQVRTFTMASFKYGAIVGTPIAILLIGISLWVIGKFFDAKQTAGAAIMVAAYSFVPRIMGALLGSVQAMLLDPATLNGFFRTSIGAGRFLDPDTAHPMAMALLSRVDVFTIWSTVLLAIGLSVTGKIPLKNAAWAGVVIWVAGAIPGVLTAIQQMAAR